MSRYPTSFSSDFCSGMFEGVSALSRVDGIGYSSPMGCLMHNSHTLCLRPGPTCRS